jgi:DNA sulfur modification protein DndB
MLNGIRPVEELRGLSIRKRSEFNTKTINPLLLPQLESEGWKIDKKHKNSIRLKKQKTHFALLEDRVWSLLYKMGFNQLSDEHGTDLIINPKEENSPTTKIDVVGIDDELAVAIECKSQENLSNRPEFQEELGKHALIRERFANAINNQFPEAFKRQVVLAMFLSNVRLSDNDKARAKESSIILFDDRDLKYYESLVKHLGVAAKYQFFADMVPGKSISGLEIRIPAIRIKMGGQYCYAFCISPEYLLKISYVSHRSKGKASDVTTYQRMISKSRLNKIKDYIQDDGIFPTNIVINLDKKRIVFERIHQEVDKSSDSDNGLLGWLDIKPAYKSAWIIDGQHRLYGYSGHPKASKSLVSVLAFEGLLPSKQAKLFIDINAKQKSVNQSLLEELYAELHWDAEEPQERVQAIISRSIQDLGVDHDSPLFRRIQTADIPKDKTCCITLTSLYSAIEKTGFYIIKEKHGNVIEFGPLWAGNNEDTLKRTVFILKSWFQTIHDAVPDWWDIGAEEGGGLAMNDGVSTCIHVLRSVFQHLDLKGTKLVKLDDDDLFETIKPYAIALGQYFGSLTEEERRHFRSLRTAQGIITRTRRCQKAIRDIIDNFNPEGLDEYIQQEKEQTNLKGKEITNMIELLVQRIVIEALKRECGSDESEWWIIGVPKNVRIKVTKAFEEDDGKRGGKEYYFDLIDYRKIVEEHWELFETILAYGKGNKEKRTEWMAFVNEKRNIVSHASSGVTLSLDDLTQLEEYEVWLNEKIIGTNDKDMKGIETASI